MPKYRSNTHRNDEEELTISINKAKRINDNGTIDDGWICYMHKYKDGWQESLDWFFRLDLDTLTSIIPFRLQKAVDNEDKEERT